MCTVFVTSSWSHTSFHIKGARSHEHQKCKSEMSGAYTTALNVKKLRILKIEFVCFL